MASSSIESELSSPVADPHAQLLGASAFEFLMIELVPMAERLVDELHSQQQQQQQQQGDDGAAYDDDGADGRMDEEERREAVFYRLEGLGYRVGQGLAERFSRDRPLFTENLDVIKFLCKDLWTTLFQKQVDNLKTNHRGIYVLSDNRFILLLKISTASRAEALAKAQAHLWFPCGIIRGALASMGMEATVQAESTELPSATFQIKTLQNKTV